MAANDDDEEKLLRSTALQNSASILFARQRAERELLQAKEALEQRTGELAHSLSMMRATLESTTDGILVTDGQGRITDFNMKFMEMWQIPGEIMDSREHAKLQESTARHFNDPSAFRARIEEIYNSSPIESFDVLELADGRVFERFSKIQRIEDRSVGRVWSLRDITERRQAEKELREQSEWFSVTLGSIGDGVITVDTDSRVTFLNAVAERLTGWRSADAAGKPIDEVLRIVNETTRQPAENPIYRALAEGIVVALANHTTLIRRDASEIPIEDSAAPIKNPNGETIGAVIVFHDVTDRRQKEKALQEEYAITENLYKLATAISTERDLSKVVQIITDTGTRVTRAQFGAFFPNAVDEKSTSCLPYMLSGISREAFEKFPRLRIADLFGPAFLCGKVIRLADLRDDPRFGENPPFHGMPDGPLPVVSYLAVPVISRSGEVLGGLFFGHAETGVFTERDEKIIVGVAAQAAAAMDTARLYQAEQQARSAAEEANKTKDLFLAALSHELRTPLTPVLALLSSLREESVLPEALAADLETIRRNVELEARLIDDLLDLTRITQGKLTLHYGRMPVHRTIEDAITSCLPDLKTKRLTIVRELDERNPTILADHARILQILWNLLKNSIKFTPDGGTITIRSQVTSTADAEQVTIEVQDTGLGIEASMLDRVFDAFEQGRGDITRQFGGLGLGLAISKAIADAHRGRLTAASEGIGRGSTFTLRLPCKDEELRDFPFAQPADSLPTAPMTTGAAQRPLRILLVEDHADSAAILTRLLIRMGHDVLASTTIGEALHIVEKEMQTAGIDLLISDLGLPDGSGIDLMQKLSTLHKIRGIALSGFGMDSDLKQSTAAGFSRHLIKPIDIAILRATIAEVMQTPQFTERTL